MKLGLKTSFLVMSLLGALACAGGAGCSQASADDEPVEESNAALGQTVEVPNPSGAYFASITANGSGCPAGTWGADISPDGKAFTVTFSSYEALVNPGQALAVKDCSLGINLKSPEGYSFSVSSFHYQGYAILDQPGMTARQTAKYYFMGNPVPASELRTDMNGPYDDSYTFSDTIGVTDLVWSPCGAERTLNAQTRIVLQNNAQRSGAGYLNTTSVDGEVKTVFRFGLSWRRCGDNPPPPPPPPPRPCGVLDAGEQLLQSQSVTSCDGRNQLIHQTDGHVVLYHDGRPLWWTGVINRRSDALTMQHDGNLVQGAQGRAIWNSQTWGNPGARLHVQDDCNVVIYARDGRPLWNTRTWGCVRR